GAEAGALGSHLVQRALDGLTPAIMVTRNIAAERPLLDGFAPHLFTLRNHSTSGRDHIARLIDRTGGVTVVGTYVERELSGKTVYGSIRSRPISVPSHGVHGALRGAYGASSYGNVSLELAPSVFQRTTLAARDSGMTPTMTRLAGV